MQKKSTVRIANFRRFIISIIILLAVGIFVAGVFYFISTRDSLDRNFISAEIQQDDQYTLLDDHYIVLSGDVLSSYTYDGELYWSKIVYSSNLAMTASEKLAVIYNNKTFQALTTEGEYLYSTDVIGSINRIVCGNNVIAVFSEIIEEDGTSKNMVYFYNPTGNLFDSISFYPQNIIDFGLNESDSLWVLTNDPTGVVPVSRVITYKPGVSMTGLTTIYSELIEQVYFSDDYMYIASTTNLLKYDLFGQQLSATMIYDWQVKSASFDGADDYFVLVPRAQNKDLFYTNAHIIATGKSSKINLPKQVDGLLMHGSRLYVFGRDTLYIYSEKGEYERQYKLNQDISLVSNASEGRVLVSNKDGYFFLALP